MMKRRSKPAISRVRLDGRSKDERYRTDNSRARAPAPTRPAPLVVAASERIFLLPCPTVQREKEEEEEVELLPRKCVFTAKCVVQSDVAMNN